MCVVTIENEYWTNEAVVIIKVIIRKTIRGLLNGKTIRLIFRYIILLKLVKFFVKLKSLFSHAWKIEDVRNNFICSIGVTNNTSKYTVYERHSIKSLVAVILKRIPDSEIIKEIEKETNSTFTRFGLYRVKQQIKKESYGWYKTMREGQYEVYS